MAKALTKIILTRRLGSLNKKWKDVHAQRPRLLYHYTDASGLLGMMKTKRLWATNSRFMNDPTEIEYAARLVQEGIQEQEPYYPAPLFRIVKDGVLKILNLYLEDNDEYVACFCENGDLLSQWRGYGAVGGGYAMGFSARHLGLDYYHSGELPEPLLRKVVYSPKQQKDLIKKFVKVVLDWETLGRRGPGKRNSPIDYADLAWHSLNWFVGECLNCFKDPAYEEEQEWRVIQYGRNIHGKKPVKTEFRAGRAGIIEFVEIDLTTSSGKYKGKLPVKIIRYGPTLDPSVTERSLRLLCGEKGYANQIEVKRSGVPFSA